MTDELKYTKGFIKAYGLFTLVLLVFSSLTTNIAGLPEPPTITSFTLPNIISFVGSIGGFLISLIFYSLPEFVIINYLLWIFRIISFLEILIYLKRLIHPTQV